MEYATPSSTAHAQQTQSWTLMVAGRVQGVGFRPFVYRLARDMALSGWVRNRLGQVQIHLQTAGEQLVEFERRLLDEAPPLARPRISERRRHWSAACERFEVLTSEPDEAPQIHVPPDYFTCEPCLAELRDPSDRRYRYPFINCTQCGPRYTLIRALPYDRANTTMAGFSLCPNCAAEYADPASRRFHAEPVACPDCGPHLYYVARGQAAPSPPADALDAAAAALRRGAIVAVRGVGGYHLLCDATRETAVSRLRQAKPRPHKPLAVMMPQQGTDGLAAVTQAVVAEPGTGKHLRAAERPIVLLRARPDSPLASSVAPGLDEVGIMLPYSPLHHLLLDELGRPCVATSANLSGEPVLTEPDEAEQRLGHVADAFLHHDRPIERPADDPVLRWIDGAPRPLRLGRGLAPLELELPRALPVPLVAVGGHMKNTVALGWDRRAVLSPHIGELDSPRSRRVFERTLQDLQRLYRISARAVVCDRHGGYASHRWARRCGLPRLAVWHHHAHASALAGELDPDATWLVFTWDGVGLGPDGTLWGGEALWGRPGHWERVGSLRPFRLPGGDRVAREPWRSALALCWGGGVSWQDAPTDHEVVRQAWEKNLNCAESTAVGRLFDGAAALTGLLHEASFEGQGPLWLEAQARYGHTEPVALTNRRGEDNVLRMDWTPLIPMLLDSDRTLPERAACFHASLARALVAQARAIRSHRGAFRVGLTGGVFQNRLLAESALGGLREAGFEADLPANIPCNDAGLSFGQLIEAVARGFDGGALEQPPTS